MTRTLRESRGRRLIRGCDTGACAAATSQLRLNRRVIAAVTITLNRGSPQLHTDELSICRKTLLAGLRHSLGANRYLVILIVGTRERKRDAVQHGISPIRRAAGYTGDAARDLVQETD